MSVHENFQSLSFFYNACEDGMWNIVHEMLLSSDAEAEAEAETKNLCSADGKETNTKDKVRQWINTVYPPRNQTPFWGALMANQLDILQLLLSHGNVDLVHQRRRQEETNNQYSDNNNNSHGETPIHWLIANNTEELTINLFLEHGADIHMVDNRGWTPLHTVVDNSNDDDNNNNGNGDDHSLLNFVLEHGGIDDIGRQESQHGYTPLHLAVAERKVQALETLLSSIIQQRRQQQNVMMKDIVNIPDRNGQTPIFQAIQHGDKTMVSLLLQTGADIQTVRDKRYGRTPFHWAVVSRWLGITQQLLEHFSTSSTSTSTSSKSINSNKNDNDNDNNRKNKKQRRDISDLLESQDKNGNTPLQLAIWEGDDEIVQYLFDQGANVLLLSLPTQLQLQSQQRQSNLNSNTGARDKKGNSTLHIAVASKKPKMVQMILMEHQHQQKRRQQRQEEEEEVKVKVRKEKHQQKDCRKSALLYQTNFKGNAPLHLACRLGILSIVRYLLEYGANFHQLDAAGASPLMIAAQHGQWDVVYVLLLHGAHATPTSTSTIHN